MNQMTIQKIQYSHKKTPINLLFKSCSLECRNTQKKRRRFNIQFKNWIKFKSCNIALRNLKKKRWRYKIKLNVYNKKPYKENRPYNNN